MLGRLMFLMRSKIGIRICSGRSTRRQRSGKRDTHTLGERLQRHRLLENKNKAAAFAEFGAQWVQAWQLT
eukprot:1313137-Prorocentrum_lima.AAC.1